MTPWVRRLLVANVVVYFLTELNPPLRGTLAFVPVPAYILIRPWTVITYMFVHAGLMHIFFNMLILFFFGPRLEERLGGKNFLILYVVSGVSGAALSFLFGPTARIVGASGAVYGVLLGFAMFWPTVQILIWGILPVQARWLVAGLTAMSVWLGFGGAADGVAHFAHLGGLAGAFAWIQWLRLRSPARQFKRRVYANVHAAAKDGSMVERWKRVDRSTLHEVNRSEFDRLMAKVDESGAGSLTLDERAFLDRFSN